eukprot:jgi/Ulvmu1/3532/UM163_0014.1
MQAFENGLGSAPGPRALMGRSSTDIAPGRHHHSGSRLGSTSGGIVHTIESRRILEYATLAQPSGSPLKPPPPPPPPPPQTPAIAPADVTRVRSAAALQAALQAGAQDIEVRAHINLDEVALMTIPEPMRGLFDNSSTTDRMVSAVVDNPTRSIRGNCAEAPPATFGGSMLQEPLKPRQCVLTSRRSGFRVFAEKLWVDNLMLIWDVPANKSQTEEPPGLAVLDINTPTESGQPHERAVYLTNVTFQGPSTPEIRPLRVWQASAVMLQDCTFSQITGSRSPVLLFDRCSAALHRSAFRHCRIADALVDISFASAVSWRSVTLTNTTADGGGTPADSLVGTTYFDDVTYATDPAGAPDPDDGGSAVVMPVVIGDADYIVEYGMFDDDMPFWEVPGGDGGAGEEVGDAGGASLQRHRGWGSAAADVGLYARWRRLAEVGEVGAVAFLTPSDPWLLELQRELAAVSEAAADRPQAPTAMGTVAGAAVAVPQSGAQPDGGSMSDNPLGMRGTVGLVAGLVTLFAAVIAILALCGLKKRANSNKANQPKAEGVEAVRSLGASDADASFKGAGGATTISDASAAGDGKDMFTTALSGHSPALSPQPSDYYDILSPHTDDSTAANIAAAAREGVDADGPAAGAAGAAYEAVDATGGPATDGSWRTAVSDVSPAGMAAAVLDEASASLALPDGGCAAATADAPTAVTSAATHVQLRPADADTGTTSLSESTAEMMSHGATRTLHSRSAAMSHSASSALAGPDTPALNAWPRGPASGGRAAAAGRTDAAAAAVAVATAADQLDVVASLGHLVPADSRHDSSTVSTSTSRLHDSSAIPRPSSGPDFHIPAVPMLDLGTAATPQHGDGSWIPGPLRSPIFSEGASFITCADTHRTEHEVPRMPLGPPTRIPGRELSPRSSSTGTIALQGSTSELAAAAADQTVSDWSGVVPPRKPVVAKPAAAETSSRAPTAPRFAPGTPRSDSSAESLAPEESFQFSPHGSPMQVQQPVQIAEPVSPLPPRRGAAYRQQPPPWQQAGSPGAVVPWPRDSMIAGGAWPTQHLPTPHPDDDHGSFVSCDSPTTHSLASGDSRSALSSVPGDGSVLDSNQGSSISVPLASYPAGLATARTAHDGDSGYVAGESALLESPREEPVGSDSGAVDGVPRVADQGGGPRGELAAAAAAAGMHEDLGPGMPMMAGFPWVATGLPAILEPALGESERIESDSGYIAEASGHIEGSAALGTLSQASPKRAWPMNGVASAASSPSNSGAISAAGAGEGAVPPALLAVPRAPVRPRAASGQALMWPPPRGRHVGAMSKTFPQSKVPGGVITKQRGSQLIHESHRDGIPRGASLDSEVSLATSAYFGSEVSSVAHDGESSLGDTSWRARGDLDSGAERDAGRAADGMLRPAALLSPTDTCGSGGVAVASNADSLQLQGSDRGADADSRQMDLTRSTLRQMAAEAHDAQGAVGEGALSAIGAGDSFTRCSAPLSPPAQAHSPDLDSVRGAAARGPGVGGPGAAIQSSTSAFSVPSTPGVTQRLLEADFAAILGDGTGSVETERAAASPSARGARSVGSVASPSHAQHTASGERFRVSAGPSALAPTPPQSPPLHWPPSRASTSALESVNSAGAHSTSSRGSAADAAAGGANVQAGAAGAGGNKRAGHAAGGFGAGPRSDAAVLPIPAELDMEQQRISAPEPSSLRAWAEETLDTGADVTVLAAAAAHAQPEGGLPASPLAASAPVADAERKPLTPRTGGRGRGRAGPSNTRGGRPATPTSGGRGRGTPSKGVPVRNGRTPVRGRATPSAIPRPTSGDSLELSPPRALASLHRPSSGDSAAQAQPRIAAPAAPSSAGRAIGEAQVTRTHPRGDRSASRRGDTPRPASPADPHPSAIPPPQRGSPGPSGSRPPPAPSARCAQEGPTIVSGEFSSESLQDMVRDGGQGGADVPATAAVRALCQELDSVPSGVLLCGRFQMLGRAHRRIGSHAVVQFAQEVDAQHAVAIKFYARDADFAADAAMLTRVLHEPNRAAQARLVRFVPRVKALRGSRTGSCAAGAPRHSLPPCVALERGESLQEWAARTDTAADVYELQCCAVLAQVATRLAAMHDAGYVHRDVKPANMLWMPRVQRWMVTDFHSSAATGELAALRFKLPYAPPEVARAFAAGDTESAAAPAEDAWSLGVVAFELLTARPVFAPAEEGVTQMMRQLLGHEALPWEALAAGRDGAAAAAELGWLEGPVLQLLQRSPERRMSVAAFAKACARRGRQ